MTSSDPTRWTLIRDAAGGDADARRLFAERYGPVVSAYLGARWRHHALLREIGDAQQDVFLDCFKEEGALERADPDRGGFRAFLYGVVRNVARRMETERVRERVRGEDTPNDALEADDESLSRIFDRAWARSLVRLAGDRQAATAAAGSEDAVRRVELLRLRFEEDLPIREIAARWDAEATHLHREYAKARAEYRTALQAVVREHHGGAARAVEAECVRILGLLA